MRPEPGPTDLRLLGATIGARWSCGPRSTVPPDRLRAAARTRPHGVARHAPDPAGTPGARPAGDARDRAQRWIRAERGARGSASLFAISCLAVLLLVGAALGVVAAMVRAHRAAQSAADLAALSAATALARGHEPCAAGSLTATANGARLTGCVVAGREATVTVEVTGPRWLGQAGDLAAQARAGPA